MTFNAFITSKLVTRIIFSIGALLVALVIFQAGMYVGYRVATFSINWDNARNPNNHAPHSIFEPFSRDSDDMNPQGATGQVISVKLPEFMLRSSSGNEEIVILSGTTSIRSLRSAATTSDIQVGQDVVAIGSPDEQGILHATFVRLIPQKISEGTTSSISTGSTTSSLINNK